MAAVIYILFLQPKKIAAAAFVMRLHEFVNVNLWIYFDHFQQRDVDSSK